MVINISFDGKEIDMKTFRKCKRCGSFVKKETVKGLRKEYPFYCPTCDQNMYRFETVKVERRLINKKIEAINGRN